eukprot:TRINITY_DN10513_c1_g2_i2.p1 TRINITY_DN10513_c1_g2~~TRINITY_DN10513_c1_g2_i2.p1  ORF type:complete len:1719 (+),score=372.02 TRINITY_DN10513_c1_g2_i2:65-5158(+)
MPAPLASPPATRSTSPLRIPDIRKRAARKAAVLRQVPDKARSDPLRGRRSRASTSFAAAAAISAFAGSQAAAPGSPTPRGTRGKFQALVQRARNSRALSIAIPHGDDGGLSTREPSEASEDVLASTEGDSEPESGQQPAAAAHTAKTARAAAGGELMTNLSNWNVAARNFAVALVQKLEQQMEALQQEFARLRDVPVFPFVMLLADFLDVLAHEGQSGAVPLSRDDESDPTLNALEACKQRSPSHYALQRQPTFREPAQYQASASMRHILERPAGPRQRAPKAGEQAPTLRRSLYLRACQRVYLASAEGDGLRDVIKRWETHMRYKWDKVATGEEELSGDFFEDRPTLEFRLWQLFKAIDHNRLGKIRWDNLVSYLIDSTMKGRAGAVSQQDIKKYTMVKTNEAPALYRLQKLRFLPGLHPPAYLAWVKDKERDVFRLISDTTFEPVAGGTHEVPSEHGPVVSFEVVPAHDALVVATADTCVRFYEMERASLHPRMMRKCGVSATRLKWNDRFGLLYVGTRTGGLQVWSLSPMERVLPLHAQKIPEPVLVHEASPPPHKDAITDMLFLPFDGNLVTCSLDATIKCLHNRTGAVIKTFAGHKRGVQSISYSQQFNLLVSSGVEYNPLAWVINVPNSRPFTLHDGTKPHAASLAGVYHIPSTAQCVSVDHNGMIKIWDVRTLQCVQTVNCEPAASKEELKALRWLDFEYHPGHKHIVTAAKRLVYVLEYNVQGRSVDPSSAMDYPISCAVHNERTRSFITCAKRDVKVWDDGTGVTTMAFDEVCKDDIRHLDVDQYGGKMYIGCFDGSVASYNASTGSLVNRVMLPSNCEVVRLCVVPDTTPQLVLCVTTDGVVTLIREVHGEMFHAPFLLPGGRAARLDAKTIEMDGKLGVFLIGQGRNMVSVWDSTPLSHGVAGAQWKMMHECANSPQNCDVTCIVTLCPHPCFVAADASGGLHCWSLTGPDVIHPYTCMARWVNSNARGGQSYTPTVTTMAFHPKLRLLYAGDDSGVVNVYSLTEAFSSHLRSFAPRQTSPDGEKLHARLARKRVSGTPSASRAGPRAPAWGYFGPKRAHTTTARLVRFWRAHHDHPVVSLQMLQRPACVMSAAGDCQVILWTLWGEKLTCLAKVRSENFVWSYGGRDQDPHNDVPWPHNPDAPRPVARDLRRPLTPPSSRAPAGPRSTPSPKKQKKGDAKVLLDKLGGGDALVVEQLSRHDTERDAMLAGRRADSVYSKCSAASDNRGPRKSLHSRAGSAVSLKDSSPRSVTRQSGQRRSSLGGGGGLQSLILEAPAPVDMTRRGSVPGNMRQSIPSPHPRSRASSVPSTATVDTAPLVPARETGSCGVTEPTSGATDPRDGDSDESGADSEWAETSTFADLRRLISSGASPQLLTEVLNSLVARRWRTGKDEAEEEVYGYSNLLSQFDVFHKQPKDLTTILFRKAKRKPLPAPRACPPPQQFVPAVSPRPLSRAQRAAPPLMTSMLQPPSPGQSPHSGSSPREQAPDLPAELGPGCDALRHFIRRRHLRSQRASRARPSSQPTPRVAVPLSGGVVSRGVCPDISTRRSCWSRARPPPATPAVPRQRSDGGRAAAVTGRLRLPKLASLSDLLSRSEAQAECDPEWVVVDEPPSLQPVSRASSRLASRAGPRRRAKMGEAGPAAQEGLAGGVQGYASSWLGWSASGDGIAVRRLHGKPSQKTWMTS